MQSWTLHYNKDMEALEREPKRFTSVMLGLAGVSYRERCGKLALFSLECWRLIEVYKMKRGIDRVNMVEISQDYRDSFNESGAKFKGDVRQKRFLHRER